MTDLTMITAPKTEMEELLTKVRKAGQPKVVYSPDCVLRMANEAIGIQSSALMEVEYELCRWLGLLAEGPDA